MNNDRWEQKWDFSHISCRRTGYFLYFLSDAAVRFSIHIPELVVTGSRLENLAEARNHVFGRNRVPGGVRVSEVVMRSVKDRERSYAYFDC